LYDQNAKSDYVYIVKNGTFELITNISFSNYEKFIEYVNCTKGGLLNYLSKKIGKILGKQTKIVKNDIFDMLI
jgi:hypothetical protein